MRATPPLAMRCGAWLVVLATVAVGACAVGPDFVRPTLPPAAGYLPGPAPQPTPSADGHAQRFADGAAVPADWWRRFGAPAVDATVAEALTRNATLASASASLRQSEYALRAGYGVFMPQLGADLSATRQRLSPLRFGESGPSSVFNLFTLSGAVSYVVDLFGGARREVESLHAAVDEQRATVLATYLTLTANVVNTSVARAGYRAEITATRALIDATAERLKLAEAQYTAGTVPYASVLSIRTELAALKASLPPLELHAEQAEHLLATLVGRTPAEWTPPDVELADFVLPEDLPLSLPSALARQRPDILVAEARLHEASAAIGVATAQMLPTLTLSGTLGNESSVWSALRDPNGRYWSGGGDLSVPIFQGGKGWYGRKAAVEAYNAARADYQQVVLSAFQQVADTLRALDHDAELVRDSADGLAAARAALELTDANYRAGTADYLAVLTAVGQFQTAQLGYLSAVAQRLQDTVALFAALGGGWWSADKPLAGVPSPARRESR